MINPFESIDARLSNIESLLLDLKHYPLSPVQNSSDADDVLTVKEAAKFLTLSIPTIYGLISKGELPVMKRSKRCYFSKKELLSYLKEGRKKTVFETAKEAEEFIQNRRR